MKAAASFRAISPSRLGTGAAVYPGGTQGLGVSSWTFSDWAHGRNLLCGWGFPQLSAGKFKPTAERMGSEQSFLTANAGSRRSRPGEPRSKAH